MALSIILPKYAFTNNFPVLTVSGSASSKLQVTFTLNGTVVLDDENYYFDTDGMASIRGLGDLAERYFYDTNYDIRRFSLSASITIKADNEIVSNEFPVYFCRSHVSGILTPEYMRSIPLSRCTIKYTVLAGKEYISFISSPDGAIICDIAYRSESSSVQTKSYIAYNFSDLDIYYTVDVSASTILSHLSANEQPIYWEVYVKGYKENAIRYVLDPATSFSPTTFIFSNDFGGVESFICRGIRRDEIQADRETGVMHGRAFIAKQTTLRSYNINTGMLDEGQKESLLALLSSYSLMVLTADAAIPVIINSENVSLHNFRSKLSSAEFTYSHSARNLTTYKYDRRRGIFDYTFDETFN